MAKVQTEKFEGEKIDLRQCKTTGDLGDERINPHLLLGTEVVVVAKAFVSAVTHKHDSDEELVRVQTIKVTDGYIVVDGLDAAELLTRLHEDRQRALDEILGTASMFDGVDPETGEITEPGSE